MADQTLGRGAALLLLVLAQGVTTRARGAEADGSTGPVNARAEATALHERAEAALASGDWATACPLYAASQARDPSAPTQGRIAQCLEHEGKLASALRAYEAALELVPQLDETRRRLAAERFPQYIHELEARVPQLSLRVAPPLTVASLQLDGAALSAAELGVGVRVDPGSHRLDVAAPGFAEQSCEVSLGERARLEVEIEPRRAGGAEPGCHSGGSAPPPATQALRIVLASLAPEVVPASQAAKVASAGASPVAAAALPAYPLVLPPAGGLRQEADVRRGIGYVIGGLGAAGLVTAAYLGLRALVLVDTAHCNAANECDERGARRMADAEQAQTAGFVALGAGAALLGTGALLLWQGAPAEAELASLRVSVTARGAWLEAQW